MVDRNKDLLAQINALDISAMPDDVSSLAPESTKNANASRLYQSQAIPMSTTSKYSSKFFNQDGKKSPLGRQALNRMTQNLVTAQK